MPSSNQIDVNSCDVCWLLDGDERAKPVVWCEACGSWLCGACVTDWGRRSRAGWKKMWKRFLGVATLALFACVLPAQSQVVYELACPSGTSPLTGTVTFNPSTNRYRANSCVDGNGVVTTQSGTSSSVPSLNIVGLLAEYRLTEGTGTTITDYSGNNNTGTFCAGQPTWVSSTGGLNFVGGSTQCVALPEAVNGAKTFFFAYTFDQSVNFASDGRAALLALTNATSPNIFNMGFELPLSCVTQCSFGPITTIKDLVTTTTYCCSNLYTASQNGGQGTHVVAFVNDTNDRIFTDAIEPASYFQQSTGTVWTVPAGNHWQLGGSANTFPSWFSGKIYYVALYNRALTPAEVALNTQVMQTALTQRGLKIPANGAQSASSTNDNFILDGDSIAGDLAAVATAPYNVPWFQKVTLTNAGTLWRIALGANQLITQLLPNFDPLNFPSAANSRCAVIQMAGRNDFQVAGAAVPTVTGAMVNYANRVHALNCKFFVGTLIANPTNRNTYNAYLRQHWSEFADGLIDFANDPNIGCDACNTSPYFVGDNIHPSLYGNTFLLYYTQQALNRFYGPKDWTTATTYTTAAPAATAITAATDTAITGQASTTVNSEAVFTFTSNPFLVGQEVTIAGVTPAGYNGNCVVRTRNSTQITCIIGANSLGAGSVFGTANTPLMADADGWVILGGSAAGNPSFTLQTACGYTNQLLHIKNTNTTSAWVLTPFASETIDGAATLTMPTASSGNFPVVVLQSQNTSAASPVCQWKRLQ